MECVRIDVLVGVFDGDSVWDTYQINFKPLNSTGKTPFSDKTIKSIEVKTLDYTVAAFIYYDDSSMEYVEGVKRYFYVTKAQPHSGQGETPGI